MLDDSCFTNHDDAGNTVSDYNDKTKEFRYYACKDIQPGDEVTESYTADFWLPAWYVELCKKNGFDVDFYETHK